MLVQGERRHWRFALIISLRRHRLVIPASDWIFQFGSGLNLFGLQMLGMPGPSPIAQSRQTGVVQAAGQPPPSAMNRAAVSERRLAPFARGSLIPYGRSDTH